MSNVSVWMPSYGHAGTIGRAIASVQAHDVRELLILDDNSTDGSLAIAQAYAAQDSRLTVKIQPPKPPGGSWEIAAYREALTLTGKHIVSLSTDDWLMDGVIASVEKHIDAAVVFHDYIACNMASEPMWYVRCHLHDVLPITRTPGEVVEKIEKCEPCETGIGSSIRSDCLAWLCGLEFWTMGPYADAIGYAAVGAKFGAVYSPVIGATFTVDPNGYGARNRDDPAKHAGWVAAVKAFLASTGLPENVQHIIAAKRQIGA